MLTNFMWHNFWKIDASWNAYERHACLIGWKYIEHSREEVISLWAEIE